MVELGLWRKATTATPPSSFHRCSAEAWCGFNSLSDHLGPEQSFASMATAIGVPDGFLMRST
jgi:hypothetical protein